jgi:hypothetical protein
MPNRPLAVYACSRLRCDIIQLFALTFAEAIKNDRHAKVTLFENVNKFLGYKQYGHAVRQPKKIPGKQPVSENLSTEGEVPLSSRSPSKGSYLL